MQLLTANGVVLAHPQQSRDHARAVLNVRFLWSGAESGQTATGPIAAIADFLMTSSCRSDLPIMKRPRLPLLVRPRHKGYYANPMGRWVGPTA